MLKNVTDYHYPGSLEEAASLHDRESRSFFIAGGTALALSDSKRPVELIDVGDLGLDELDLDEAKGKIEIGATTSIQRIVEHQGIKSVLNGFLSENLEKLVATRSGTPELSEALSFTRFPGRTSLPSCQ